MKGPAIGLWIALLVCTACASGAPVNSRIVVSRDGNSVSAPNLEAAMHVAADMRRAHREGDITIALPAGTVRLARPVTIGSKESGSGAGRLTIRGAPGRATHIVGSVALGAPLRSVPEDVARRLRPDARDHVRAYRLPASARTPGRIQEPRVLARRDAPVAFEVYDREGALRPARWPNDSWAQVIEGGDLGFSFVADRDRERLERWNEEDDLWAEGYWRWGWLFESLPVRDIQPASGLISLEQRPFEGFQPGARFRIVHALSELDEPGEWWRDRKSGLLIAWPRGAAEELEISVSPTLFEVVGAKNVRLEGLVLERAHGDMVSVRASDRFSIADSVVREAGGRGLTISKSIASGVERTDFAQIGATAVVLDGGSRIDLTAGDLFVRNCRFVDYARLARTQTPAIALDGVGQTVERSIFYDTDAYAVHIRGNEHRVAWNEFSNLIFGSTDNGVIYAGRDWTARGNIIEHNYFHDVRAAEGYEVKGVYLDDMASGFAVRDNLFLNVDQPVFIGGGRENVISRNIFISSSPSIHLDSRGETWASGSITDPESELRAAFSAMPINSARWRAFYPTLDRLLFDTPNVAKDNVITDNLYIDADPQRFTEMATPDKQTISSNRGPDGLKATYNKRIPAAVTTANGTLIKRLDEFDTGVSR